MKKQYVIFLLAAFTIFRCYSQNYPFIGVTYISDPDLFYRFTENRYEIKTYDMDCNPHIQSYQCTYIEKGAYLVAEIKNDTESNELYIFCSEKDHILMYDMNKRESLTATRLYGSIDEPYFHGISLIKASSFLTEKINGKEVSYPGKNLSSDDVDKAWVEGVKGNGIGEYISFSNVMEGSRKIYFINGFFSPDKPSLFYDNNRVKKLKINCYDRDGKLVDVVEKDIADTGHMQSIDFNSRYASFDFIIEDVYPGRKYDDTAISAIFVDELDLYRQ